MALTSRRGVTRTQNIREGRTLSFSNLQKNSPKPVEKAKKKNPNNNTLVQSSAQNLVLMSRVKKEAQPNAKGRPLLLKIGNLQAPGSIPFSLNSRARNTANSFLSLTKSSEAKTTTVTGQTFSTRSSFTLPIRTNGSLSTDRPHFYCVNYFGPLNTFRTEEPFQNRILLKYFFIELYWIQRRKLLLAIVFNNLNESQNRSYISCIFL